MTDPNSITASEERCPGQDGLEIYVRTWRPTTNPRASIVLVHGFNSHSGYYIWAGEQLAAMGLVVYALDLRGRGRSDGERFYVEGFADYVNDVATVVALTTSRDPGLPLYLLGHSAGGVVACLFTLEHQGELAGLICESFAFRVPAPDFVLATLKGLSHLAPHAHVLRLKNEDFSRNRAVVNVMNADPLIAHESQPTNTVAEMVLADERLEREFPSITLPLLILHGTADRATKPSGSQMFFDASTSKDKTLNLYEGHFHDLLNDLDRDVVLADITSWINARVPGSGPVVNV